jgi:hypothetical protein
MRRLLTVSILVLFSAAIALAQDPLSQGRQDQDRDDHDDKAPIQSGYAVVTPVTTSGTAIVLNAKINETATGLAATTTGTTTGLVVFETFGMRGEGNLGTTQAGVLPPDLTTNAMMFVDSEGRLSKNLGVAIVNPSSTNANVSLTLRKADGTQLGTTTVNVPSHQQTSKFVTELFATQSSVPKDVTGTLVITSVGTSGPVSVIGLRFRGRNFSTLPITNLSGNAGPLPGIAEGVGGDGAVLLPQFAAGGGWATELVLANTSTSPMTVRVDLFKNDGTPLSAALNGKTASSFRDLHIPAGGVIVLAPRDKDGDDDF